MTAGRRSCSLNATNTSIASRWAIREHPLTLSCCGADGQEAKQAATERLAAIPLNEGRVILATGKYIGEGFDDPRLDTLFLTLPVSWRGTIAQYVGRLHRLYDGKREVRVYDYADLNVPMLARMFDRRCRGYEALGYTIRPSGQRNSGLARRRPVACRSDWKRDYAASVRRLVRDGVDLRWHTCS